MKIHLDMVRLRTLLLIILLTVAACQQNPSLPEEAPVPTLFILPSSTPEPEQVTPSDPTETPTNTITPLPLTSTQVSAEATMTFTPVPVISIPNIDPTSAPPTSAPVFLPAMFSFGQSVRGSDLLAHRFGEATGNTVIMLVGGIHGGFEMNTVTLIEEMIAHYRLHPNDILPGVTLVLIPSLNPDGVTFGRTYAGRFNANGVDLNRNWGCGWEALAYFREEQVYPGSAPFSEPETLYMAALINDVRPDVVLFYHSAANGIFDGDCNSSNISAEMASVLGGVTGYPFGQGFSDYPVTGTASNWVSSLGIPAADVELADANATEFLRNLPGVMALQCWALREAASQFPVCSA